jgi:hypothetical protein
MKHAQLRSIAGAAPSLDRKAGIHSQVVAVVAGFFVVG